MSLFGFGKKNTDEEKEQRESAGIQEETPEAQSDLLHFAFGVCDSFRIDNSEDIMVVGRLSGTIHAGDAVYLSNPGDDSTAVTLSVVDSLERQEEDGSSVYPAEATDERIIMRVRDGAKAFVKPGTVIHSRAATVAEVHTAYINGIGDGYVAIRKGTLTEEDIKVMSITDLAETWRLINFAMSKRTDRSQEVYRETYEKIGIIAKALSEKLYASEHIYVVYNKNTGEPNLYSRTVKRENRYECTPPDIMVVSEAYRTVYARSFEGTPHELRKIENGEDGKGIYHFLGECFFLNGALGVEFLYPEVSIAYEQFMAKPDYSGRREADIPVTNPDVERWQLLLGQLGEPDTDDKKLIYGLYCRFFGQALLKGRFLVPMKLPEDMPAPVEREGVGDITLNKGQTIGLAMQEGKNGRKAVRLYTDWKRFRMEYNESYNGLVQTIDSLIGLYDIVLNATEFIAAGSYISKEMYDDIKAEEG